MCRFIAYIGAPVLLDELLYHPENSIIRQSFKARERKEPLNGDGFGVGWYVPDIQPEPARYVSIRPAWNDFNLRSIAALTRTPCVMAHVRAATRGEVSQRNCHPFAYKNLLMMHNGTIYGFHDIRRAILEQLSDDMFHWVRGSTDTEHFFALFLDKLNCTKSPTADTAYETFQESLQSIESLKKKANIQERTVVNAVVSDGTWMLAVRFSSAVDRVPPTLYYSAGAAYRCKDSVCTMERVATAQSTVLVVSEKLTDNAQDWIEIPSNHALLVSPGHDVELRKL